jgi:pyruvate dehydrogenase E2 component (dihydrolipoyllysine-residue acetyltransferase)
VAHPILMPKPGQMTEECVLVAWHKDEGEAVHRGDVLFEIETDKSVMDVESFDDGVLLRRYVKEGETVPVNSICAYVGEPGEAVPDEIPGSAASQTASTTSPPLLVTPAGPAAAVPPAAAAAAAAPGERLAAGDRLAISPRASRLAISAGVDPRSVTGTGPGGRITEHDVQAAIDAAAAASIPPPEGALLDAAAASTAATDEEPRPMSRMRRVIAERLTLSATTIPQFHVTVSVDMTRALTLRAELRDAGVELSITDFVVAATAQTLAEFPEVNSRTDGTTVWLRRRVHLGLAVSVPGGLVVPVVRDADRRSLTQLHERTGALAASARNGTLAPDDMVGGTFTISNLGMFGVDQFDAIINPGEAAILAVSSVVPTPVVAGDGLAVRQVMKLTLTADHRLVDGELGARFLNALRRRLQDVEAFRAEALHA